MKRILLVTLLIPLLSFGQEKNSNPIDAIKNIPKVKVLMVGTFHFAYPGLDSHQDKKQIDVLSEEYQKEIKEITDALLKFKPDKIALEFKSESQEYMDSLYQAYQKNNLELGANEIFQLGFRMAKQLDHPRIYGIDENRRRYNFIMEMTDKDWEEKEEELIGHLIQVRPDSKDYYPMWEAFYDYKNELLVNTSLKDYILSVNSEEYMSISHGIYLTNSFKLGIGVMEGDDKYFGADNRTAWYNRNLRIFQNIQRTMEPGDQRILVIVGSGHLPILKHCIEYSPEFEWVDLTEYLK